MKRLIILLLCFLLTLSACAQPNPAQDIRDPVSFFYLRTAFSYGQQDAVIVCEQREADGHREDLEYLLSLYIQGPIGEGLESPFPSGLRLIEAAVLEDTVFVTLSSRFSTLSDMDMTLACACLTKTCLSLTDARQVTISCDGQTLGSSFSITLTEDDLLLLDTSTSEPE
ncbi:MAG: GerMN domain-containing protein [Oscillospiraceae bacterium]|nr:GerMN domain-containing protein [Oscillospiraceae bacterium]